MRIRASACLLLAVAACGNAGTASTSTMADIEGFCTKAMTRVCAARAKCQPAAFSDWHHGDQASCVSQLTQRCVAQNGLPGVAPKQAALDACLAAIDDSCDTYYLGQQGVPPSAACRGAGTLPAGAGCALSAQCASGYCDAIPGLLCGGCAPRPAGGPGAPCERPEGCDVGLVCTRRTCVAPAKDNEACGADAPCLPSLACIDGTCKPRVAEGGACMGDVCPFEQACFMGKCTRLGFAALGQPCGLLLSGPMACDRGLKCKLPDDAGISSQAGTCVAEVPAGGACTGRYVFQNQPCAWPSACVDGVCADPFKHLASCGAPTVLTPAPTTCSPRKVARVPVNINNTSGKDATLFWVDYDCQEKANGLVPVGARPFESAVDQIYRFRDPLTGALLKEVVATQGASFTLP